MRNMKRFTIGALAFLMVFAVCSTAFADGIRFNGRCINNFNLSQTWNKINDRTLEIYGTNCVIDGSSTSTKWMSTIKVGGYVNGKLVNPYDSTFKKHIWENNYQGTAVANVKNSYNPGSYIRAQGEWYIYNGATHRELNYPKP